MPGTAKTTRKGRSIQPPAAVEQQQRQADDDRRDREGQVDERVEQRLAAEAARGRARARSGCRRPCSAARRSPRSPSSARRRGSRPASSRSRRPRPGPARRSGRRRGRPGRAAARPGSPARPSAGGCGYTRTAAPDRARAPTARPRRRAAAPRRPRPRPSSRRSRPGCRRRPPRPASGTGCCREIRTTEPNSPTARAKPSAAPETMAGTRLGRMIRRKVVSAGRAERRRGLLHLAVELEQHGLHRPHDERQRHEQQRQDDRRPRADDVDAGRAVGPVERQQRDAGDDRRQREGQVDERVDDALARELVADEDPGHERARHRVDRRDPERAGQRELQRRDRRRRGHRVPERRQAALGRLRDHGGQGQQDDDAQPQRGDPEAEGARAGAPRAPAGPPGPGAGSARHLSVETPALCSILATAPVAGSKRSALIWSQPPMSRMVNRPLGVGKRLWCSASTEGSTGR